MITFIECYVLALSINYLNESSGLSCDTGTLRGLHFTDEKTKARSYEVKHVECRRQEGTSGWTLIAEH